MKTAAYEFVCRAIASKEDHTVLNEASKELHSVVIALRATKPRNQPSRGPTTAICSFQERKLMKDPPALIISPSSDQTPGQPNRCIRPEIGLSSPTYRQAHLKSTATDGVKNASRKDSEENAEKLALTVQVCTLMKTSSQPLTRKKSDSTQYATRKRRNERKRRTFDGFLRTRLSIPRKPLLREKRGTTLDMGEPRRNDYQ
ncbi:hypothetical protein V3C99_018488 [Haemonchus contortus]|uniref:PID domain-containing protein n=1 Tax=Haemonchus contortus TaxID=6289 RepID=A0A7I4Z4I1_HAECO